MTWDGRGSARRSALRLAVGLAALSVAACQADRGPSSLAGPKPAMATPSPSQLAGVIVIPFDLRGTGDRDLVFESTTKWSIAWSFTCNNPQRSGDFALTVVGAQGATHQGASGSGAQGQGTVAGDSQEGQYTLALRSACDWHLTGRQ